MERETGGSQSSVFKVYILYTSSTTLLQLE